mgnify:CR=1 FL=1
MYLTKPQARLQKTRVCAMIIFDEKDTLRELNYAKEKNKYLINFQLSVLNIQSFSPSVYSHGPI